MRNSSSFATRRCSISRISTLPAGLAALPARQRQVILLRYYKDLTQQQAAQILRISQVQVSRIEKKALQALAQDMDADAET